MSAGYVLVNAGTMGRQSPRRARLYSIDRNTFSVSMTSRPSSSRLWPLFALNFFMADMQSGIGPFVGVFLQERAWASGLIGTTMTIGNVAGMLITTPIGGFIDASRNKRLWVRWRAPRSCRR